MLFLAYLCAVLKCIIYGTTIFFTSRLVRSIDVLDLLALRFLLSFFVMWILKTARVWKIHVGIRDLFSRRPGARPMKNLFLAALFEPVLYMFFETAGVALTTNITAAVITSLAPISSCIIEETLLKEKSTVLQKIFLACGIFGVLYIAFNTETGDGANSIAGILFLFLCVCSGSLYSAFSRKSSAGFSSLEITYFSCMLGALVFNAVNVVRHLFTGDILHYFDPYLDPANIPAFLFLSVVSTVVAVAMGNFALSRIQLSTMAAFGGISTLVTIAVGVVFGHEKLYVYHLIGLFFILLRMVGVSAISIQKEKKPHCERGKKTPCRMPDGRKTAKRQVRTPKKYTGAEKNV